jgi:hypothetical protein
MIYEGITATNTIGAQSPLNGSVVMEIKGLTYQAVKRLK